MGSEDEPILFAICGDISRKAEYSPCVLLATSSQIFTYDLVKEEVSEKYSFGDIENIYNKRMYGNGIMRIVLKTGEQTEMFRFTFAVAALCDAAITYVKDIRDGVSVQEAYGVMEAVFEKMLSVCPKCGSHNLDYLTRVIGYLKRVSSFSEMRQEEAEHRFYAEK